MDLHTDTFGDPADPNGPPIDASDYSSDDSLPSAIHQPSSDNRQQGGGRRRRPHQRHAASTPEVSLLPHESIFPQVYKFTDICPSNSNDSMETGIIDSDRIGTHQLKELINYNSSDLLTRAWHLLPASQKKKYSPPFSALPSCPNLLEVRFGDITATSAFMCATAMELSDRSKEVTLIQLRSLLVRSAVHDDGQNMTMTASHLKAYEDSSIVSCWETDGAIENEMDCEDLIDGEVNAIDFIVALSSTLDTRLPLHNLSLFHRIVNKCIQSSDMRVLNTWGVKYIASVLMNQLEDGAEKDTGDDKWVSTAITLLYKIVISTSNTDLLLSLFRWTYTHAAYAGKTKALGISAFVNYIESLSLGRISLTLPTTNVIKGQQISFPHSLFSSQFSILGFCVIGSEPDLECILLSDAGIYRVSLKPPFNIISHSEAYIPTSCRGVLVQDDTHISVIEGDGYPLVVNVVDTESLEIEETISSPHAKDNDFFVYAGKNGFAAPHYMCDALNGPHLCLETGGKGTMDPNTVLLPRTCDSLSVQFFLCPTAVSHTGTLCVISATTNEKNWLTVKIVQNPRSATLKIIFEHGVDTVAEVEDVPSPEWALWSGTLTSVGDLSSWSIYKNGIQCDSKAKSGQLIRPLGPVGISIVTGSFSGFISTLQLWSRAQNIGDMRSFASDCTGSSKSQFIILNFRLDEGVGNSFHSRQSGLVWNGARYSWLKAPKTLPVKNRASERISWRPNGDYYIVSNEYEVAIIEEGRATWIREDGIIIRQEETKIRYQDRPFFATENGKLYTLSPEGSGLRATVSSTVSPRYARTLSSVKEHNRFCPHLAAADTCTALELAEYFALKMNVKLLTMDNTATPIFSMSDISVISFKTIGRLLDICSDIRLRLTSRVSLPFDSILLCICGRLLTKQVKLLERQCPSKVVPLIVTMFRFLQSHDSKADLYSQEIHDVFEELHRVVLAECVSHDYQLKLIMESSDLKDVQQLLAPENLPALVTSVIEKDMKKPFMNLLNRLKEACLLEAESIFAQSPLVFAASEAMLSVVLGMLSQKERYQWHLIAVALISSLCKAVLKRFEQYFQHEEMRMKNIPLLKTTALGLVLFPVVHYLYDMRIDPAVAADALRTLNDMRTYLSRYALDINKSTPDYFRFPEVHTVVVYPQTGSFSASLDLRHAQSVKVEMSPFSSAGEEPPPHIFISLIDNDYIRHSDSISSGELVIEKGGHLFIESKSSDATNSGVSLGITADVEVVMEKTDWLRDICLALSHIIVKVTHQTQLSLIPHDAVDVAPNSFLRGGLSNKVLVSHKLSQPEPSDPLHEKLVLLANGEDKDSPIATFWTNLFSSKRFFYAERLENVVRWSCCALTWHLLKPDDSLEQELEKQLDWLKKKVFLLLEALQQKREVDIIERAKFLIHDACPRTKGETDVADHLHTEEPIAGVSSDQVSKGVSRGTRSYGRRSRNFTMSYRNVGVEALKLTSSAQASRMNRNIAAVNVFSKGIRGQSIPLHSQIFDYLINGSGEEPQKTRDRLLSRTRQAVGHLSAYKLQEELCTSYATDRDMLASILTTHLQYRNSLSQNAVSSEAEVLKAGGFNHHYAEHMRGCGFVKELELQKSACAFVQTALRILLARLDSTKGFPLMESFNMCAILCHPWDGVDMSILHPGDIFLFLRRLLSAAFTLKLGSNRNLDKDLFYIENKGLFDLFHRCLIIPNSLLQVSVEGVQVIEGEAQGLQVENTNVVCSARNHWKPLYYNTNISPKQGECDYYANYGLPCIVAELPDVQYFEITLDLSVHEVPKLSLGLSSSSLAPAEPVPLRSAVVFSANGIVTLLEESSCRFSEPWRVGDVIGCGVFAPRNSVFFTRNGQFLGVAVESNFATLIPFVEVQGAESLMKVIVNFGKDHPFKFDLASLHCSSRHRYITSTTICDAVLITVHYLITMCFRNLSSDDDRDRENRDSVSTLLECAASFLNSCILELTEMHNTQSITTSGNSSEEADARESTIKMISVMISRIYHCIALVIDCFRFDVVTAKTHTKVLQVCALTLTSSHDKWIKVRAAQCLSMVRQTMREDYLAEAADDFSRIISIEEIVHQLVELARSKLIRETDAPLPPPKWVGNTNVVKGKGTFFGSSPLPKRGNHMIGFRIRRKHQIGQGPGSPLGGCYYIGLCHGQPSISSMNSLISRSDVYILQDTDDQDQVPHLLLKRQCIPRNSHRRIYGNDEIVWVQFNADLGEITYYREGMVLIGLAFANIQRTDDLFPIVYNFNDDASCEILPAPVLYDESAEHLSEKLRRSVAIHTLQQLHLVPYFSSVISHMIQRSICQLDRGLDSCLVALAVLGGERSYLFCQHDTYGLVVVHAISEVSSKAVVYLSNDEERHLFCVAPQSLKPSFIQTPLYASGSTEAINCATLLSTELHKSLHDASIVAPLIREESHRRELIESEYIQSIDDTTTLDLIGILSISRLPDPKKITPLTQLLSGGADSVMSFQQSTSSLIQTISPVTVERQYSTNSIFTPNPSIAVTTSNGCSTIRGNSILSDKFTLLISIAQCSQESILYVGLSSSTDTFPEQVEEVANWHDSWVLCSCDSAKTNNVNCCVEPSMIFSGDSTLYGSRDILVLDVCRSEGSLSFSRIRKGKRFDFGVLFEGIPWEVDVRPIVVSGTDTIAVFSFLDGSTFPARNTFPKSNFYSLEAPLHLSVFCSVCECPLAPPWYAGSDGISLCDACFKSWQYPKELFFVAQVPQTAPTIPLHLVSGHIPETLQTGGYVEFEENSVLTWSAMKSVNVESNGPSCVSVYDEGFAVTESLSLYDGVRIDMRLGYVAGVPGHPFSGLLSFMPMWRDEQQTKPTCVLQSESLAISSSVIPHNTRALFSVQVRVRVTDAKLSSPVALSNIFIGTTNLSDTTYTVTRSDLERLCADNNIWGTWCDTKEKISSDGTIYILVDTIHGSVAISSSLGGLFFSPSVVTFGATAEKDKSLRLAVFSHDACLITSFDGLTSYSDTVEPSVSPIAVGLVPESFSAPDKDLFGDSIVLMDTLSRTETFSSTHWNFSDHALHCNDGTLFRIDDTITVIQQGGDIRMYCQGHLIASAKLSQTQSSQRYRLMLYLSARGLSVTFVPPLYGRSHLGRIQKVYGTEVCQVECASDTWGKQTFTVRRKDVRFCALAASEQAEPLTEGTHIAFKTGAIQPPKRATVCSIKDNVVSVCETGDERSVTHLPADQCFILDNEAKETTRQVLYPLVTPPTSTVMKVFEVGKSKYRLPSKSSYNGIIFDCRTNDSIELVGLSALCQTTGRHRADVFFKKGSHKNHERDARSWTPLFSGFVDMIAERQFSVTFAPIHIDAGCTFAVYINTSHNCGVGFFCEEDGCHGEVGADLDDDGTITVFLGKKSGSSTAFGDFSVSSRGFSGTIMYKQNKGSKPPLIEGEKSSEYFVDAPPTVHGDTYTVVSRPALTTVRSAVHFSMDVLKVPVRVESLSVPVTLGATTTYGLYHCVLSVLYRRCSEDLSGREDDGEWHWAWNTRALIDSLTTTVCVKGTDIHLGVGRYRFAVVVRDSLGDQGSDEARPGLLDASNPQYAKKNALVTVKGFYGDILVEADSPDSGESHTMSTGAQLNQSNSASYNGIMFDLRSKQDITLDEIFCISQTTAVHVTVRLFWKEGSMEGAEKSAVQWREVSAKEMQLIDKQPFSVGPLFLRMKANQTYSVYINTTSSCGVRFYNSSDGHVGDIGDEFENDGILSVLVGRKSESASPFAEIPMEPRAFRGMIMYRTDTVSTAEYSDHALFSYLRAFIVTRMLVALSSFVDSASNYTDSRFSYERLLSSVTALATSPSKSISDLVGAENLLSSMLNDTTSAELQSAVVTIPLSCDTAPGLKHLSRGDLALLVNPQDPSNTSVIRISASALNTDESVTVHYVDDNEIFKVPVKRVIPLAKCWRCQQLYATSDVCEDTHCPHRPPPDEETRVIAMLGHAIALKFNVNTQEALALAKLLIQDPSLNLKDSARRISQDECHATDSTPTSSSDGKGRLSFSIPMSLLSPEVDHHTDCHVTCPFVFCNVMGALVALTAESRGQSVSLSITTDYAIRTAHHIQKDRCFSMQLCIVSKKSSRHAQIGSPFCFIGSSEGIVCETLLTDAASSLFSSMCSGDAVVGILLTITEVPLPPPTNPLPYVSETWAWEEGMIETHLCSSRPTFLRGNFTSSAWPAGKPHFCTFMVLAQGKDKAAFLEVHVVEGHNRSGSWDLTKASTVTRKPFSLSSGEIVTLGFSTEGDFFIFDSDDIIRCRLTCSELKPSHRDLRRKIGFVSVGNDKVVGLLAIAEDARRNSRALYAPEKPGSHGNDYEPIWEMCDAVKVKISKNKQTASCNGEGAQTAIGSSMPAEGVSSFVMKIERYDRPLGAPLGSGHFAGVVALPFTEIPSHFSEVKKFPNVWAVQDVQDNDSLPHQAPIPVMEGEKIHNELFGVGTKLLFIIDRGAGTISLARDNESPRIIFQGIPHGVALCPFVRLDHITSSATVSRFYPNAVDSTLYQPSLEKAALSQPMTPSFLRRFPLSVVLKLFPAMLHVVNSLPSSCAAQLERCWSDLDAHSRFGYRVAKTLEVMIEIGAFSKDMIDCGQDRVEELFSQPEMVRCMTSLVNILPREIVSFPSPCLLDAVCTYFRLPENYELVGRVPETDMARIVYIDATRGPIERTLHMIQLTDSKWRPRVTNDVLSHPSVIHQQNILKSLNGSHTCGIIFDGWFDCTLASLRETLDAQEERKIATAVMCAVEHWHLHRMAHGHLMPENVLLRLSNRAVTHCALWNAHYLPRSSEYASANLSRDGSRDIPGDLWSCSALLKKLTSAVSDPAIAKCLRVLEEGQTNISDILRENDAFQDVPEDDGEGPSLTLRTGARLRGGSGSYNGIMFDVVTKNTTIRITKVTFVPDTNSTATVTLFTKEGSFLGAENDVTVWRKVIEKEMPLSDNVEMPLDGFEPITVSAGSRAGLFLHTTSGSGVLFYSETEGVVAGVGQVEEENTDIGITVGKKSESGQPFTAIQNQKRLLKGSITYTLITRSNGPRSSLIYTYDPKGADDSRQSTHSAVTTVRVGTEGVGLCLQTLADQQRSLVLRPNSDHLTWVDSASIHRVAFQDNDPELARLDSCMANLRTKFQMDAMQSYLNQDVWCGMRPLSFTSCSGECHNDALPLLVREGDVWLSETLRETCTLSICVSPQSSVLVCLVKDSDSSRAVDRDFILEQSNIMEGMDTIFMMFNSIRQCLFTSSMTETPMESLRIAICMRDGRGQGAPSASANVSAHVSLPSQCNSPSSRRNCTVIRLDSPSAVTTSCGAVITHKHTTAENGNLTLRFASLTGQPSQLRITEVGLGLSAEPLVKVIRDTFEEPEVTLPSCTSGILIVESLELTPWSPAPTLLFSAQSPAIDIGERAVTQVLYSVSPKCVVLSPRFNESEMHEVILRVVCPREKPIRISLESPSNTGYIVDLPYHIFDAAPSPSFAPEHMEEFLLQLHIDLYGKHAFIVGATGTYADALRHAPSIPAELRLVFTLMSPGSSVNIVSWQLANSRTDMTVTQAKLAKAVESIGTEFVSFNISHSVGVITRHSSRSNAPPSQDYSLSVTKQMEVLVVSYARLLLEKALVAQEAARAAVHHQLHSLFSFTTLRSSPAVAGIIDSELKYGSVYLLAQSCVYLMAPLVMQTTTGIETSVNIIQHCLKHDAVRELLRSSLGPTLVLLLLRTATIFPRVNRHIALRCAQELLSKAEFPLPSHELLDAHLGPMLGMISGLCRRGKLSSAVVQIGVTLVADIIQRYSLSRPTLPPPGKRSAIPYHIVACARAVIDAITHDPPLPLPAAMTRERKSAHVIHCDLVQKPLNMHGMASVYASFNEENRDPESTKSFQITVGESRKGAIILGWDLDNSPDETAQRKLAIPEHDHEQLPSCGYYVEPTMGKLYVCLGRKKEDSHLKIKARPGDVIVVSCSYRDQVITVSLMRGTHRELSTNFRPTTGERIDLPFLFAQHGGDMTTSLDGLASGFISLNVEEMYAEYQNNRDAVDTVPAQSYDFYAELNLFVHAVLDSKDRLSRESVHAHDIAGYAHISSFVGASAFVEEVPITALHPYLSRLRLFDSLTRSFSPLINLKRKSELFDIFRYLKNLCSKEVEEKIQSEVMRPYQSRQGRKAHVTIHTMQAQPSASLGPYPTLIRSVFGQLYLQLQRSCIDTFFVSPIFTVKLAGFGSTDAGGPYRDVLSQLASEIMTVHPSEQFQLNPLFIQCGRGGADAIMPNPDLMNSTQTPLMLEFFGKLLASFFITTDLLAVEFPPLFWKLLLNEDTSVHDLTILDPDIVQQLAPDELTARTEEELEERFAGISDTWRMIVSENPQMLLDEALPPSTLEGAQLLSDRIVDHELNRFAEAIGYIQHGFDQVVPHYTLQAFRWQKVELLICGTPKLSYEAFKNECDIQLMPPDAARFLSVLEGMTDEDRTLLLRFTTGQSRLPLKSRIKVQHNGSKNSLPTSSTCFFALRLPLYTSEETMKERLLYAIRQCKAIDADGQARENLVLDGH